MPDEIGFKRVGIAGQARKGYLKAVTGILQQEKIFPLAAKADAIWKDITDEWDKINLKL